MRFVAMSQFGGLVSILTSIYELFGGQGGVQRDIYPSAVLSCQYCNTGTHHQLKSFKKDRRAMRGSLQIKKESLYGV
jgi:hypothetical protein